MGSRQVTCAARSTLFIGTQKVPAQTSLRRWSPHILACIVCVCRAALLLVRERTWTTPCIGCVLSSAVWKQGPRRENGGSSSPPVGRQMLGEQQTGCVCEAEAVSKARVPGPPRGGSSEHQLLAQPLGAMRPAGAKGTHLCEALGMGKPALPFQTPYHRPTYMHTQRPKERGTRTGRPEPGQWSGRGWWHLKAAVTEAETTPCLSPPGPQQLLASGCDG